MREIAGGVMISLKDYRQMRKDYGIRDVDKIILPPKR